MKPSGMTGDLQRPAMAIKQARRSRRCAPKDEIAAKGAKWADLAFGKFILVAQRVPAKPKESCGNRCIAIQGASVFATRPYLWGACPCIRASR